MNLDNRVYIVTGASSGFGLAICKALVEAGAKVGLVSRGQQKLDAAVDELGSENAFAAAADVAKRAELSAAFAGIKAHFGRLDGIINNAGMARPNAIEHLDEAEVLMQVNTNYLGTVFGCQAAIPLLRGGDNPRIINISSASAFHFDEMLHLSIYTSTKAAVERFTRDLRLEMQADNIAVTCIRPGAGPTNFASDWDMDNFKVALQAWQRTGPHMEVGMEAEHVGQAVVQALSYPPGVAVDLMEVRPNQQVPKLNL